MSLSPIGSITTAVFREFTYLMSPNKHENGCKLSVVVGSEVKINLL